MFPGNRTDRPTTAWDLQQPSSGYNIRLWLPDQEERDLSRG
jgi:hypothetical protein